MLPIKSVITMLQLQVFKLTNEYATWHVRVHTPPFNGPFSGTALVSRYQKGKTNMDFTETRDSGWQWHPLGHMQVCMSLQTDNHPSTPPLSFFAGQMPFLPPNQQRQSTEGKPVITVLQLWYFKLTNEYATGLYWHVNKKNHTTRYYQRGHFCNGGLNNSNS